MNWSDEITINDLVGGLELPLTQVDNVKFAIVINNECEFRLRHILGDTFYELFKANFDLEIEQAEPEEGEEYQNADMIKLWNGGIFNTVNGNTRFDGLKSMCIEFVYCKFVQNGYMTLTGKKQSQESNSTNSDGFNFNNDIEKRNMRAVSISHIAYFVLELNFDGVEYKHFEV